MSTGSPNGELKVTLEEVSSQEQVSANEGSARALMNRAMRDEDGKPVAFDERNDPRVYWKPDPCDDLIPSKRGLISDMIYYTRGHEVATLFVVWAGVFAISSAVKREAWLKWADKKMYSNVYAMIVAPAGMVKKNTAIDLAVQMLKNLDYEIKDQNIRRMKMIKPFTSKATPEALVTQMVPKNRPGHDFALVDKGGMPILNKEQRPIKWYKKSELAIAQTELGQLIGKQSYMEGLTTLLLDFYDCKDEWSAMTQMRGDEQLVGIFATFLGAIAPPALKASLPEQSTGDGFLSRCMVVYQSGTERMYKRPSIPEGAPSLKDLRERLGWIAANTFGEWDLNAEAEAWLDEWYPKFKKQLALDGMLQGVKSRFDTMLYKLSMVMRWQRYDREDNLIHREDLIDAEHIIRRTFAESTPIYRMLNGVGNGDRSLKVEQYLERVGKCSRQDITQKAHVPADDVTVAVDQLFSEGKIGVYYKGLELDAPTHRGVEEYVWSAAHKSEMVELNRPKNKREGIVNG